jgi:hypothetical protein
LRSRRGTIHSTRLSSSICSTRPPAPYGPSKVPSSGFEGWRADGLLIARTATDLLAFDPALEVRESVSGVRAQQVLVAGSRIFAVNDGALSIVTASGQRRIGTVPPRTWLIAVL